MAYSCYKLTDDARSIMSGLFEPTHPDVINDHITHRFPDSEFPPEVNKIKLVGYAKNDKVEAFVAEINGSTTRPDGKLYHLTYSVDRENGGKPVHSNSLLSNGYDPLVMSIHLPVLAFLKF